MEILWNCLSKDDVGREFLYVWLLDQLKSNSKHAIDGDMLNYILQKKVRKIIVLGEISKNYPRFHFFFLGELFQPRHVIEHGIDFTAHFFAR